MNPLTRIEARAAVLDIQNIDTDQIIPARFLTTTTREGLGRHAFHDWRHAADGTPDPAFFLNQDAGTPRVLFAGDNFGCGSSREHAPWALLDAGIRAVVSTRIADIFRNNALKNGLLAIVVAPAEWAALVAATQAGGSVTIDLVANEIRAGDTAVAFRIDPFARACLLEGVDELGYLMKRVDRIDAFERSRAA